MSSEKDTVTALRLSPATAETMDGGVVSMMTVRRAGAVATSLPGTRTRARYWAWSSEDFLRTGVVY